MMRLKYSTGDVELCPCGLEIAGQASLEVVPVRPI